MKSHILRLALHLTLSLFRRQPHTSCCAGVRPRHHPSSALNAMEVETRVRGSEQLRLSLCIAHSCQAEEDMEDTGRCHSGRQRHFRGMGDG